eukprot:scaffold125634_cov21-Prasinocladus_malaysianus.AAC.1
MDKTVITMGSTWGFQEMGRCWMAPGSMQSAERMGTAPMMWLTQPVEDSLMRGGRPYTAKSRIMNLSAHRPSGNL